MREHVDKPIDYSKGHVMEEFSLGPILWEQHRLAKDKYFVETSLYLALLDSHTNMSLMTSIDQGIPC